MAALAPRSVRAILLLLLAATAAGTLAMVGLLALGVIPRDPAWVYKPRGNAPVEVIRESLPGDLALFRDGFDKSGLASFDDLGRQAGGYAKRWRAPLMQRGLSEAQAQAVSLMLFTSTLWAFGNAGRDDLPGCIPQNEDNEWKTQAPTLEVVKRARIGCCTDYAQALSFLLSRHGFENRTVAIPGHVFNEALIDGRWQALDANTNIFLGEPWNEAIQRDAPLRVRVFAHPGALPGRLHRAALEGFQTFIVERLVRGIARTGRITPGREPDAGYARPIEKLY